MKSPSEFTLAGAGESLYDPPEEGSLASYPRQDSRVPARHKQREKGGGNARIARLTRFNCVARPSGLWAIVGRTHGERAPESHSERVRRSRSALGWVEWCPVQAEVSF